MFDGSEFPKSLDEGTFNQWLEEGRNKKIGYNYLLVLWDEYDSKYKPVYVEKRDGIDDYEPYHTSVGRESLVAAYDLYSESRIR